MHLYDVCAYEWVHGLVDADAGARAAALARHCALVKERRGEPDGSLVDLVEFFSGWGGNRPHLDLAPYAVLFLQWELRFPAEWRDSWPYSPWSSKRGILSTFRTYGPTPETAAALEDLLLATVSRAQRCQDCWYIHLARRIDNTTLRTRLTAAAEADDERTRLRARFVLWALDHPQAHVGAAAWRHWLRSEGRPVTHPVAALELAGMKPAAAAAELVDLEPANVARVLEGLHAGPAAQILGAMRPAESAARAVELMDVLMAVRALKAMDPAFAATVLTAMEPSAAAARLTSSSRPQLLALMGTDAAVAHLRALPPAAARERLRWLPPERLMALVWHMDPDVADPVLDEVWGSVRLHRRVSRPGPE